MTRMSRVAILVIAATLLLVPTPALAHGLVGRLESPLPLVVYLAGAALAVALSFAIALAHDGRWRQGPASPVRRVPRPLIILLRGIGLLAWAWVVAQFV